MQYIRGLEAFCGEKRTAVTLGKFDGLHRGHEKLIRSVQACAREEHLESLVCAFDMRAFAADRPPKRTLLMTKEERRRRLEGRVDYLVDCPFTKEFSRMPAEDFIRDILSGLFHASCVAAGTDCSFGFEKRGNIRMLKKYEKICGYRLLVVEKEKYRGREISSTYIKKLLAAGDLALANYLLGYPYQICGTVEHGRQLGRTLGFPTINVAPDDVKLMPPRGVYVSSVEIDGREYPAITNVGIKPTVSDACRMLSESYLFDYHGDAYGREAVVSLHEFRRPEKKFADLAELKACIDQDIACGKKWFENR